MKNAIITGASSGIGRAIACEMAKEGYNLLLISRNAERLKGITEDVRKKFNVKALYVPFDLYKNRNYELIVQVALESLDSIDVLVNNAGIGPRHRIEEITQEEIERIFWTNFFSHVLLTKHVIPYMKEQESGVIANIISLVAFYPIKYWSLYNASKAAMESFFKTLRKELKGTGITITNVYPGWTDTEFFENAGINKEKLKKKIAGYLMDSPEYVARKVVRGIKKRKKEVFMHWWGWLLAKIHGFI